MELTSSTIELKIINTISVESTNTPSPFETTADWDHFTAEKKNHEDYEITYLFQKCP
jgi:hypothetical protein